MVMVSGVEKGACDCLIAGERFAEVGWRVLTAKSHDDESRWALGNTDPGVQELTA